MNNKNKRPGDIGDTSDFKGNKIKHLEGMYKFRLPLAEGLSQLRFISFRKTRSMKHLEVLPLLGLIKNKKTLRSQSLSDIQGQDIKKPLEGSAEVQLLANLKNPFQSGELAGL